MDRRVEASDASLDPRGRTPAWSMRTLYRLYEMWCQPILAREKISASHWIMLRILVEQGDLNQLELGQHAGIPATTMVNALDGLESRALIRRTRDPLDRRKYNVGVTDEGRALLGRLLPDFHDAAHQSMAGVPGEDVAVFWRVLLKIEANLSDMLKLAVLLD
jgi:DNA-binding MarR family transcriptional regulator